MVVVERDLPVVGCYTGHHPTPTRLLSSPYPRFFVVLTE